MNKIINNTFGRFKDSDVTLTSLFGGNNTCISIMNWGASIQNWTINNSENCSNSVVLGFENFDCGTRAYVHDTHTCTQYRYGKKNDQN